MERIQAQARSFRLQLDVDRIGVFCGDITKPNLGLAEAEWEFCCREVQQIVHSSAHVNHIEGYAPFRPSTQGMREVIRMASARRVKLIHFISSIAACTFFDGKQVSIHEKEEFIDDGFSVFGGYGQSKWVQETFLRRAHAQGLPFMIYRFGELGGSSRTGLAQTEDMVHRLVQMRLSLGVREKICNDVLDMLPVDIAARVVARGSEAIRNKILHATHPRPCPMPAFYAFAQKQGYAFQHVSRAEYLAKCMDYIRYVGAANPVDAFILECVVMREVNGLARNMRAMDGYFVILFPFDQANFLDCLAAVGLELPPWDELLERLFRNWNGLNRDFFERIHGFSKWQESQNENAFAKHGASVP
jgi:thioester reductase-like protein